MALRLAEGNERILVQAGDFPLAPHHPAPALRLTLEEAQTASWIGRLGIAGGDRIVIFTARPDTYTPFIETLGATSPTPPVMLVTEQPVALAISARPYVTQVNLAEIARERLSREWRAVAIRQKAFRLWTLLKDARKPLIITQNDPDPDAIASGMAVQALLGSEIKSTLATLGRVTRNENLAMTRLLKRPVKTIAAADIPAYDRVVFVDVQPPYFPPGLFHRVDAVLDHHPGAGDYDAAFRDVDTTYGATATMMFEYLDAGGIPISERLATALLYGVITDTMLLARDSSERDFNAFAALWPRANHNLLAGMSRPRLNADELKYFVRAIRARRAVEDFLFIWLGSVEREDIIPRMADFSLQIGETVVTGVAGVVDGAVSLSARNTDLNLDVGEMISHVFSPFGGAGGHRSMAKAVFPLSAFRKATGARTLSQVGDALMTMMRLALADRRK